MEHWEEEGKIRQSFYFELPLWVLTFICLLTSGLTASVLSLFAGLVLITAEYLVHKRKNKVGYTIVITTLLYEAFKHFLT